MPADHLLDHPLLADQRKIEACIGSQSKFLALSSSWLESSETLSQHHLIFSHNLFSFLCDNSKEIRNLLTLTLMQSLFKKSTLLVALLVTGMLAACSAPSTSPSDANNGASSLNQNQNAGTDANVGAVDANAAKQAEDPSFTNLGRQLGDADVKQYNGYSINELTKKYTTVYFAFDSYAPVNDDLKLIEGHAQFIKATGAKVLLEGYTDERGTPQYNVTLGSERARSVYELLVKHGVAPESIRRLSYGEEKPAVLGHTEAAYSKNRRVVFNYNF